MQPSGPEVSHGDLGHVIVACASAEVAWRSRSAREFRSDEEIFAGEGDFDPRTINVGDMHREIVDSAPGARQRSRSSDTLTALTGRSGALVVVMLLLVGVATWQLRRIAAGHALDGMPSGVMVEIQPIHYWLGKPPLMNAVVDVTLDNGSAEPRWVLLPEALFHYNERTSMYATSVSTYVSGRGR